MIPEDNSGAVRIRRRKRFNLAHSVAGVLLLLGVEGAMIGMFDLIFRTNTAGGIAVLLGALIGGLFIIFIATEVIEEVRNQMHMLVLLTAVVFEFIVFFAFQYWYLSATIPGSFQSLGLDPISMLLHSTMVFALNPLNAPLSSIAQTLLLINTLESLVLAFFVLQNVWQFRRNPIEL